MKTFLILFLSITSLTLSGQNNFKVTDSITISTPEGIGEYLSNLLINRGDIKESPISININRLFPDRDISEFEDSPAMFILSLLYSQQLLLAPRWDNLLSEADNLEIETNTKYIKTYFFQTNNDQFRALVILEKDLQYYAFYFKIIEWEGKKYIMETDDKLRKVDITYDMITDFCLSQGMFEVKDEEFPQSTYSYNEYPYLVKEVLIPSLNSFIYKLTFMLEESEKYDENIFITASELIDIIASTPNSDIDDQEIIDIKESLANSRKDAIHKIKLKYNTRQRKQWEDLLSSLSKGKEINLSLDNTSLDNLNIEENTYNALLTYLFKNEGITYTFTCYAVLIDEKWKLSNISPIEKENKLHFF